MYLASSSMPNDEYFTFPQSLGPIRFSLRKAEEILICSKCHENRTQRQQNTLFMITLLTSLGCAFDKLLKDVDSEAQSLCAMGEKKLFTMGDASPQFMHLHTGTRDCPMRFDVNMDAEDWRKMAFEAIKTQISNIGNDGGLTLSSMLDRFEERQRNWHAAAGVQPSEGSSHTDSTCVQLTKNVRKIIEGLPS